MWFMSESWTLTWVQSQPTTHYAHCYYTTHKAEERIVTAGKDPCLQASPPLFCKQSLLNCVLQMLFGVPNERQEEAKEYISAIQAGLRKVQGAIDLKYVWKVCASSVTLAVVTEQAA